VVIPTRNRRGLLARTLATVRAQRVETLEVIVVDDGSTDGTADFVDSLGDGRVRCVSNRRRLGVAAARNVGVESARCDNVAFVDDDDLWSPRMLAHHLAARARHPEARWSTAGAVEVDVALRIQGVTRPPEHASIPRRLLSGNPIPGGCSNVVACTDLVREVGGFDPSFGMMADWDLWIRLAQVAPAAVVPEPLMLYVLHGGNMSLDVGNSLRELGAIERKHAAARAEEGIDHIEDGVMRWIANRAGLSGRRYVAARLFGQLAVRRRSPALLGLAANACRGPRAFQAASTAFRAPFDAGAHAYALALVDEVRAVLATPEYLDAQQQPATSSHLAPARR
jgi:glycosyltransferase involved in cell wall biosynthesis